MDIRNKSLTALDFQGSVQGSQGPVGAPGAAGAPGAPGSAGLATVFASTGATVTVAPGEVGGAQAFCPAGMAVIGTGFFASVGNVGYVQRFGSFVGIGVINDTTIDIDITAQAICGGGPGVVSRGDDRSVEDAQAAYEAEPADLSARVAAS
jgi:hypothetical protein